MNTNSEFLLNKTIDLIKKTGDITNEVEFVLRKIKLENLSYPDGAKLLSHFSFQLYDPWSLVTDLHVIYTRFYTYEMTYDLGMNWFSFTGSLLANSRPCCIAMSQRRYFHKVEFEDLIKGKIGGKKYKVNKQFSFVNKDNYQFLVNGMGCGHQLNPISDVSVPLELKNKFK